MGVGVGSSCGGVNKIVSSSCGSSSNKGVRKFNRTCGSSGMKCFGCGEPSYRQSECKKTAVKKALFIETDDYDEDEVEIEGEVVYDEEAVDEVHLEGDVGTVLVVRRACLTPKVVDEDDWLRSNIFQSIYTI